MTSTGFPFDRDEMMRLGREGMEQTMRFYMNMNENLLKLADMQKDALNQANQRTVETLNKAYEEYQKNSRVAFSRMESLIHTALEHADPKTKAREK